MVPLVAYPQGDVGLGYRLPCNQKTDATPWNRRAPIWIEVIALWFETASLTEVYDHH